jgi:hypothetical protein
MSRQPAVFFFINVDEVQRYCASAARAISISSFTAQRACILKWRLGMLACQEIIDADLSPDPAQIVSGTLCLMSCALTSLLSSVLNAVPTQDTVAGNVFYIRRIADNLSLLANDLNLDPHFRRVCRRLCEHWEMKLNLINEPAPSIESRSRKAQPGTPTHITSRADAPALAPAPAPAPAPTHTRAITEALAASVHLH